MNIKWPSVLISPADATTSARLLLKTYTELEISCKKLIDYPSLALYRQDAFRRALSPFM